MWDSPCRTKEELNSRNEIIAVPIMQQKNTEGKSKPIRIKYKDMELEIPSGTETADITVGGTFASSVIYSLVETAKANNLDPYRYLLFLLTELPQVDGPLSSDMIC